MTTLDLSADAVTLTEQLVNPVDFAGQIERMYDDGFRVFVEFGPKGVLSRLVTDTLGDREAFVLALDGGPVATLALRPGRIAPNAGGDGVLPAGAEVVLEPV